MKRNASVLLLAGGAIALAVWQLAPANGSGHATHATQEVAVTPSIATAPTNSPAPAASAGYVVHLDESGQVSPEATTEDAAEFNAAINEMISTSHEGLSVENSPVPGGGGMIDLQGRFQSTATATVDANGNVVVPCLTNEADARAFTSTTAATSAAKKE